MSLIEQFRKAEDAAFLEAMRNTRDALPETKWRLTNRIGPVTPAPWGEPSSHDLFAKLQSRNIWSSWSDLADQIGAGASPLQLIVAPGGALTGI